MGYDSSDGVFRSHSAERWRRFLWQWGGSTTLDGSIAEYSVVFERCVTRLRSRGEITRYCRQLLGNARGWWCGWGAQRGGGRARTTGSSQVRTVHFPTLGAEYSEAEARRAGILHVSEWSAIRRAPEWT